MKTTILLALSFSLLATFAQTNADTIELKNGTTLQGEYTGGTATTVNIATAQGVFAVNTDDIIALRFSSAPAVPPVPVAPAPVLQVASPVTIPAGTVLVIRMDTQIASTDKAGTRFTAKLVADLMAGNATIAKAGTTVFGQVDQSKQAGRLAGKSQLAISLTGVDLAGKILPIMTTNFAEAGKGEFRKTARNVAGGALIGNAIDNDGGAGVGAVVGVGASLIKKGDAVTIPPGALLEFRLTQPVAVTAG